MDTTSQYGGYIGMIALLVGVAISVLLFTRVYLTPETPPAAKEFQPLTASGTVPQTGIEQMRADVDAAREVQEMLNAHNTEINEFGQE